MSIVPQTAKGLSNEMSVETVFHNQNCEILTEARNSTREYGQKIAWDRAREVIAKFWEDNKSNPMRTAQIENSVEQV